MARPFCNWELPKSFDRLQRYLQARFGNKGKREYIQVLQLLRDFPMREIRRGIERAFEHSCVNFETIRMLVISGREPNISILQLSQEKLQTLPKVQVELVNITCYATLLSGGAL